MKFHNYLLFVRISLTTQVVKRKTKRRFTNLNTKATDSEIRSFVNIIAHLINETFDKVEVVKTQVLA